MLGSVTEVADTLQFWLQKIDKTTGVHVPRAPLRCGAWMSYGVTKCWWIRSVEFDPC
jgi:hypothetical protein